MNSIARTHDHPAEIRRTLQLAAPVMLGQVAVFSMSFVDTVMAGRLPQRELALAGLGIGSSVWSALMMFLVGLLLAVQPSVAQLDGAGDRPAAAALTRQAAWIALAVALPYWATCFFSAPLLLALGIAPEIVPVAAGYLRALSYGAPALCGVFLLRYFCEGAGHTRPTLAYGLFGALLNIPLNWVLMYGKLGLPALGTVGCGIATSIVLWLQFWLLLTYAGRHRHFREYALLSRFDAPQPERLYELLRLGLPIAVTISPEGGLFVTAAMLIGRLGPLASAGHLVAINFSALVFMLPLGLASALTIRVGNAIGRGDPAGARYAGIIGLALVTCTQTCSMLLIVLFPEAIVRIYTDEAAVAAVAVQLLFFAAIFQLPDGIQICAAGALRGLKDTRIPMLLNLLAYWVVGMSLGYWLTFRAGWGPAGMWMGMIAGLTVGAVLMTARFLLISRVPPEATDR